MLDELVQRNNLLLLRWIDTANHRREPAVLELDDHRSLHIRRGRNHARHMIDLSLQCAPIVHDVLGRDENVRIEIDHLLAQLAIEPSHDGDHENQHRYPEHHAQHRDEGDDREKRALRF